MSYVNDINRLEPAFDFADRQVVIRDGLDLTIIGAALHVERNEQSLDRQLAFAELLNPFWKEARRFRSVS